MPFSCLLWVAILLLLNILPLRWRNTCLLRIMEGAQLCIGQPRRVSCPWWSTSSNLADLMWKQETRLGFVDCSFYFALVTALKIRDAAWAQICSTECRFLTIVCRCLWMCQVLLPFWILLTLLLFWILHQWIIQYIVLIPMCCCTCNMLHHNDIMIICQMSQHASISQVCIISHTH